MAQQALDQPIYTYRDYLTWPEERRCELIDGRIFSMAPAPSLDHQTVVVELTTQIAIQLRGKPCRVFSAPFDVRLPEGTEAENEIKNVVQPDVLVVCDSKKLDQKGCLGAPDWIIEVLSSGTAAKDHIHKRLLYERHGVLEYWLVHPTDRLVTIYRLNTEGKYNQAEILETRGRHRVDILPDLEIDWDIVFRNL
jgi:Uma2 family endonuclease